MVGWFNSFGLPRKDSENIFILGRMSTCAWSSHWKILGLMMQFCDSLWCQVAREEIIQHFAALFALVFVFWLFGSFLCFFQKEIRRIAMVETQGHWSVSTTDSINQPICSNQSTAIITLNRKTGKHHANEELWTKKSKDKQADEMMMMMMMMMLRWKTLPSTNPCSTLPVTPSAIHAHNSWCHKVRSRFVTCNGSNWCVEWMVNYMDIQCNKQYFYVVTHLFIIYNLNN